MKPSNRRLVDIESPWDDLRSPNAVEWGTVEDETTMAMAIYGQRPKVVIHWHGHVLSGLSLKG